MNPTASAPTVDAPVPPDSVVVSPADSQANAPEPPDSVVANPGDPDNTRETAPVPNQPVKITLLEGMKVLFDEKVGLTPVQVVDKNDAIKNERKPGNGSIH